MHIRSGIFIAFWALCVLATPVHAIPPILILNYTPPTPAFELVSLKPDNHQTLDKPPSEVVASFTETVDSERSTLKVYDPYNNLITSQGNSPKDTGMLATLPVAKMLAGTYRIDWQATCACHDKTMITGTSYFTIY